MKGVYVASSVQDLANLAESSLPPIDNGMKLILYYRSAQQILLQANIYKSEGDFEKAYIHMMKYSILVISKLPKHSQYNQPDVAVQNAIQSAKQTVRTLLQELEGMKLVLKKQYEEEQRAAEMQKKKEQEELQAIEQEKEQRRKREEQEKAEQEALILAQQEERMRLEHEQQQRLAMELFAKQQLQGSTESQHSNDGVLQPTNPTPPTLQSDILFPLQAGMEQLQLTEQPTLQHQPQHTSSEILPIDFFMSQGQSPLAEFPPQTPQVQNPLAPQVDFLTPMPLPTPAPTNEPSSPVTLLDLSHEVEPNLPAHYSHLSALVPAAVEKPQHFNVQDSAKTPVDYPNLYSKSPSTYTATSSRYQPPPVNAPQPSRFNAAPSPQSRAQPPYLPTQYPTPASQPPMYMPTHPSFVSPNGYGQPIAAVGNPSYAVRSVPYTPQPVAASQARPSQTQANSPKFMPSPSSSQAIQSTKVVSKPSVSSGPIEESPTDAFGPSPAVRSNTLRKLVVYGEMFEAFMRVANSNTQRKIETCAILSGTLSKNVFHVTTMIVPKQEGTTDTCSTTNEEELFEYQMANNLLTLGWIHTHPTQDCFMSSVDLHTHCTYQLLLPEAIAVVISPMYTPNFGIFRVSDPPGMQIIQKCTLRGFHQHADTLGKTLYTLCDHVDLVWGTKNFKVVDLR